MPILSLDKMHISLEMSMLFERQVTGSAPNVLNVFKILQQSPVRSPMWRVKTGSNVSESHSGETVSATATMDPMIPIGSTAC